MSDVMPLTTGGTARCAGFGMWTVLCLALHCTLSAVHAFDCFTADIYRLSTADCTDKSYRDVPKGLDYKIQVLIFRDNLVTSLDAREFQAYGMLQEIYMDRNRITLVHEDAFSGLANLRQLSLEMNQLREIPSASFRHISKVRVVNLRGNQIQRIDAHALQQLRHLEEINLENNYISYVDARAFHGLVLLNEINLANNELQTLAGNMQLLLPVSLHTFRIYYNPWMCDCHLRWLRRWLAGSNSSAADNNWRFTEKTPSCAGPERIANVNWMQLTPPQFACAARIVSNSSNPTHVSLGGNVSLQCEVYGDPAPQITWRRGARALRADGQRVHIYNASDPTIRHIKSVLTLYRVTSRDMTDYKCVAENSAGVATMTYTLWAEGGVVAPIEDDDDVTMFGLHKEIILGIAIAGAVLIIIVLSIMVTFLCRQQDRHKQAYKPQQNSKAATAAAVEQGHKSPSSGAKRRSKSQTDRRGYSEQDKSQHSSESRELLAARQQQLQQSADETAAAAEIGSNGHQHKPPPPPPTTHEIDTKTKYIASYDCVHEGVKLQGSNTGVGRPNQATRAVSPPRAAAKSQNTPDLLKDGGSSGACADISTSRSIPVPPPVVPTHLSNSRHPRAEENPYVKPSELRHHQQQQQQQQMMTRKTASADDLLDSRHDTDNQLRRGSRSRDDLDDYIQTKPKENHSHYSTLGSAKYKDHSKTCKNPVCLKDPNLGLAVDDETVVEQRTFLKSPPKPRCVHEEVDAESLHGYDARGPLSGTVRDTSTYRTLPSRPNMPQHQQRPHQVNSSQAEPMYSTVQAPRASALSRQPKSGGKSTQTKTVSFSEQGHPIIDLTQQMPTPIAMSGQRKSQTRTPGDYGQSPARGPGDYGKSPARGPGDYGKSPARGPGDYGTYSSVVFSSQAAKGMPGYSSPLSHVIAARGPESISGVIPTSQQRAPVLSTIYGTHRSPVAAGAYAHRGSTLPNGSPRRHLPRQPSTTVDELLSPPFGHVPQAPPTASRTLPHKRQGPRPGEKDEFGTAV